MAKGYFVVRAEVPDSADRAAFDHWYATDHLPWAIEAFAAQRGWRCWSRTDPAVHYAYYEFADVAQAEALIGSDKIKPLAEDFDRVWGTRVARQREVLDLGSGAGIAAELARDHALLPLSRKLCSGAGELRGGKPRS